MYQRRQLKTLRARLSEPRKFIQVLMGPRQVGKTTMVHQLLPDIPNYIFESADAVGSNPTWLEQIWETARIQLNMSPGSECLLVVDEIQKVENWSEIVKKLWDEDTHRNLNLKVLL